MKINNNESRFDKFKCTNCGYCCMNMDNLALFEWEKDRLSSNSNIEIVPGNSVDYNGVKIIVYWGLRAINKQGESKSNKTHKGGICPFLSFSNQISRCTIYKDRPLVCRAFPFFHLGFNSLEGMISLDCPAHIIPFKEGDKLTKQDFYVKLLDIYGDTFIDAFRLELARVWISDLSDAVLSYLNDNNIQLESYGINENEIGLLDLAIKLKIISKEEIESEIKFIYSDKIYDFFNQNQNDHHKS